MKTVIIERVQLCEIVIGNIDLVLWNESNPGKSEEEYIEWLIGKVSEEDTAWTTSQVFVVGTMEDSEGSI